MFYKHVGSATEMDTGFWGGGRGQVPSAKASVEPRWPLAGRGGGGTTAGLDSSRSAMWHCCYC